MEDLGGPWTQGLEKKDVQRLTPISSTTIISVNPPVDAGYFLKIRVYGGPVISFSCGQPLVCGGPLDLTGALRGKLPNLENAVTRFLAAISRMFHENPAPFAWTLSREGETADEVVLDATGSKGWEQVASGQASRAFFVEFLRVLPSGEVDIPSLPKPVPVTWNPSRKTVTLSNPLAMGLFRVSLCRSLGAGAFTREGPSRWALVVPNMKIKDAEEELTYARETAKNLTPGAAVSEQRALVRAYLVDLVGQGRLF